METRFPAEKKDCGGRPEPDVFECQAEPLQRGAPKPQAGKAYSISWVALVVVVIAALAVFKLAGRILLVPLMFLFTKPVLILGAIALLLYWKWWRRQS